MIKVRLNQKMIDFAGNELQRMDNNGNEYCTSNDLIETFQTLIGEINILILGDTD